MQQIIVDGANQNNTGTTYTVQNASSQNNAISCVAGNIKGGSDLYKISWGSNNLGFAQITSYVSNT
jgi:hypothetical protein